MTEGYRPLTGELEAQGRVEGVVAMESGGSEG
jgi:hypothetical protein